MNLNQSDKEKISLENQTADYVASAVKSVVGAVPFFGSFLAELTGITIPNQRSDRIAKLTIFLEQALEKQDKDLIRLKLNDENFTDLAEESIRHAVRAVSDDRLKYIVSLLANGIRSEDINLIESKHLLRILGELNDVEIIWLKSYTFVSRESVKGFHDKHKEILEPIRAYIGSSQLSHEKESLQKSYKEHLAQLGLLKAMFEVDYKTKQPVFDNYGRMKIRGYDLTQLGSLLLKQIDFSTT